MDGPLKCRSRLHETAESDEVPVSYRKRIGKSKVSGTIKGIIGAGTKILGTIFLAAAGGLPGRPVALTASLSSPRYPCKARPRPASFLPWERMGHEPPAEDD